ncbi:MAG: hypothetical protein VB957_08640 [Pseudomonadales bacterium]|jgi:hypothetical protein
MARATNSGAIIESVRVAAAHDGDAELIVSIRYDNGGISEVTLDQIASAALMKSCEASTMEELHGHSWEKIREALQLSYNRYL